MRFIHTCSIERRERIKDKGLTSAYKVIARDIPCQALPSTTDSNIQQTLEIGQNYDVFLPKDTDIRESDRLTISTGVELYVNGVADYKDVPHISHIELACSTRRN